MLLSSITQAANTYSLWFNSANSTANITYFQASMTIPPRSAELSSIHNIWPGLQPQDNSFVYQTVVSDLVGGNLTIPNGIWGIYEEECCDPNDVQAATFSTANPGDVLGNAFERDDQGGWWANWTIAPGKNSPDGKSQFMRHHSTGFSRKNDAGVQVDVGKFTNALLSVELHDNATWDFGPVNWTDIEITIETKDTEWCTRGPVVAGPAFPFQVAPGKLLPSVGGGNSTTCSFEYAIMSPPGNNSTGSAPNGSTISMRSIPRESATSRRHCHGTYLEMLATVLAIVLAFFAFSVLLEKCFRLMIDRADYECLCDEKYGQC